MDHVVYLDKKEGELDQLLSGKKSMIIRGAAGRKMPYGRVNAGDILYLLENDGSGLVRAEAEVIDSIHSDKLEKDQSIAMVQKYQDKLQLSDAQFKRWAGKRYLVLIEVGDVLSLEPFGIDKTDYGNMDDWLLVEEIRKVQLD